LKATPRSPARLLIGSGLLGGASAVILAAFSYIAYRWGGLSFIPYDIFDWMARVLPGGVLKLTIDSLVRVITVLNLGPTSSIAKLAEQGIALVQFLFFGVVAGSILGLWAHRKTGSLTVPGVLLGVFSGCGMAIIQTGLRPSQPGLPARAAWSAGLFLLWGGMLGRLVQELMIHKAASPQGNTGTRPENFLARRQFLYLSGMGSLAVLLGAVGLRLVRQGEVEPDLDNFNEPAESPGNLGRIEPAAGTRPEITPRGKFYRIDIDVIAPEIDAETWQLEITGQVEKPLMLSLEDLHARPAVTQAITLACISNPVGGDLISTALWTGVPLKDLLIESGLKPDATGIVITAVDDYYETVPLQQAMDERTLLVYAMNGEPLPVKHGYPLRIYIPDLYGMKQPKWITRLVAVSDRSEGSKGSGFWVDRDWTLSGVVHITSAIDAVAIGQKQVLTGRVPVGGIAFAGARGISWVEIRVDDGAWELAELRLPPLGKLTWVQWVYHWAAPQGVHKLYVRAVDGSGQMQESEERPTFPDGATGIDSFVVNIREK
jgi:DMSO/TMAO reductase YedYZ molybdopterin-dependent catalytic subunit